MILTVNDLCAFTEKEAKRVPILTSETRLIQPGCTEMQIQDLVTWEPQIPPVYLACARSVRLKGVNIPGWFRLWPGGNATKETFVGALKEVNSSGWQHQSEYRAMGLIRSASWNDTDVCVALSSSSLFKPDAVVRFRMSDTLDDPLVMCSDFEKFLLAAGNVAELLTISDLLSETKTDSLLQRLPLIGLSPAETETWREVGKVVFSE
jgi:hypothetical protein